MSKTGCQHFCGNLWLEGHYLLCYLFAYILLHFYVFCFTLRVAYYAGYFNGVLQLHRIILGSISCVYANLDRETYCL